MPMWHPSPAVRRGFAVLLGVLAAVALVKVMADLGLVLKGVTSAIFATYVALRLTLRSGRRAWIPALLGGLLIPILGLAGVDIVWAVIADWLDRGRPDPWWSTAAGIFILASAYVIYLGTWWLPFRCGFPWTVGIGVTAAVVLVLAPSLVIKLFEHDSRSETPAQTLAAVSSLNVIVLGEEFTTTPVIQQRRGWQLITWGGRRLRGDRIAWDVKGPPPAKPSKNADQILVLDLDGAFAASADAAPDADVEHASDRKRWLALADRAASAGTPTYALLKDSDAGREGAWRRALDEDSDGRIGGVFDVGEVPTGTDVADVALALTLRDAETTSGLKLAADYAPFLFFDEHENSPNPLNIDQLLKHKLLSQCRHGQSVRALCQEIHSSADIDNEYDSFAFDPRELASLPTSDRESDPTVIYVHVTRSGNDVDDTLYLDYWWFLPDNPTGAAGGAFCGAGFNVAGLTCVDHQSDWEGVTVVLDSQRPERPLGVTYAIHELNVRYSWQLLERVWQSDGDLPRFAHDLIAPRSPLRRPLVFVANGTHAAYPRSCVSVRDRTNCRAGGLPGRAPARGLSETSHNGGKPWIGNRSGACLIGCLEPLPTYGPARRAARWNAFRGRWGLQACLAGLWCTSHRPPRSPSFQNRYRAPWCYDVAFDVDGDRFVRKAGNKDTDGDCPLRKRSAVTGGTPARAS